jgi:hypothetical protein
VPLSDWCDVAEEDVGAHNLTTLAARAADLEVGCDATALCVPTNYASEERIAFDALAKTLRPHSSSKAPGKQPNTVRRLRRNPCHRICFCAVDFHRAYQTPPVEGPPDA